MGGCNAKLKRSEIVPRSSDIVSSNGVPEPALRPMKIPRRFAFFTGAQTAEQINANINRKNEYNRLMELMWELSGGKANHQQQMNILIQLEGTPEEVAVGDDGGVHGDDVGNMGVADPHVEENMETA
jgi:hypothetical protein